MATTLITLTILARLPQVFFRCQTGIVQAVILHRHQQLTPELPYRLLLQQFKLAAALFY